MADLYGALLGPLSFSMLASRKVYSSCVFTQSRKIPYFAALILISHCHARLSLLSQIFHPFSIHLKQ